MPRFAIRFVIAILSFTFLQFFIPLCSPLLPHWLICVVVGLTMFIINVFYLFGFLISTKGKTINTGNIISVLSFIVVVIVIYYASIYNAFYSFDKNLFYCTTSKSLNTLDFCYFSI